MAAITDGLELPGQVRKQTSFDITNYPPARKGLAQPIPGDAARAARMQAQYDQPVTKGLPLIGQGIAGISDTAGQPRHNSFDITNTPSAQRQAGITPGLTQSSAAGIERPVSLGNQAITQGLPELGQSLDAWARTGIGAGRSGGEIVGRRGAGGLMEFTNNAATPGSVATARPMQAGEFGRLGDGIGTFSQSEPGDAARSYQSFERANEIRRETVRESRRGQIGEGGGRLTIVHDSSRSPSIRDTLNDRRDARQASTAAAKQQTQQSILSGMDERLTGQLQRQLLGQQIQAGEQEGKRQQALSGILAGLDDPKLQGSARTQAERSYLLQAAPSAFASLTAKAGANPLSAPIQRLEDEDLAAIGSAGTMNSELARIDNQISTGQLNLGLLANAKSSALNSMGIGDQNARNYASLNSTLEKLRNESLRLNTGVQTEGDAQRAWNELLTNLKSPELVRQRLAEISALNERAIGIRTGIINNRRAGQGATPLDVDSVLGNQAPRSSQPRPAASGRPVTIETDSDYDALPSGAQFIARWLYPEETIMASWKDAPVVGAESEQQPAWASAPVEQPAAQPESEQLGGIGAARSLLRGANDALTFGFADEISSAASATLNPLAGTGNDGDTWGERYSKNVEGERALDRQARQNNPMASAAGGIAGGLLPMIATGGASLLPSAARSTAGPISRVAAQVSATQATPGMLRAAGEGAAVGGAYGAAYGLGSAEGDLMERLPGAVDGMTVGAAIGAGIPVALMGGRSLYSAARSPDRAAAHQVERALERDGMTVDQFRRQADDLQQRYPGAAMPADAGGENVKGLLERVSQTPGAGRSQVIPALTERQQGQPQRITSTLQELTKSERDSFNRAADDLGRATGNKRGAHQATEEAMAQRARDAQPLYEKAYQEPVPWSHELEKLFERPAMQDGYRLAARRAANEGRTFQGKFIDLKDDGSFTMKDVPSTGDLDLIKKSLDSKVGTLERAGDYGEARVIKGIRTKLLEMMDAASPTYREARAAWAGPSQFIDALNDGRTILSRNISAEELASNLGRLNASELDGFRIGALSAISNKMHNDPSKMADMTKYLRSKEMRGKVAAMLPDDAARQRWGEMLDFEVSASATAGRSLGNSATARRAAEMADADSLGGDLVLSALAGTPVGSLFSQFINKAGRGLRDKLRSRSDQSVADALTSPEGLAGVQSRAAQASSTAAPSMLITGGASAGAIQGTTDREARPTVQSLMPAIRERMRADYPLDADELARETGATRAAAKMAIAMARRDQQATAATYKSVPGANKALRGLNNSSDYMVAKTGDREWRIQLKAQ